jgi:hypothetical protein
VDDTGLETTLDSAGNVGVGEKSGAHSGARGDADAILADRNDPRLLWLNDAWPALGEDVKGEILRLAGYDVDDLDDVTTDAASERMAL